MVFLLNSKLKKCLRGYTKMSPTIRKELEDMGYVTVGELEPTDNFYLTENGISFFYNVYDIAPYAVGAIEISLPYEMLSHLLSDDFGVIQQ